MTKTAPDHIPLNVTRQQRANLRKLSRYLFQLRSPNRFSMETFYSLRGLLGGGRCILPKYAAQHPCGSIACAIGYGPAAGIPARKCENWYSYSERAFGVIHGADEFEFRLDPLWYWCFDAPWFVTDNTPRGAAQRIVYALKHGIPQNYKAQLLGSAPLSYTKEKRP